MQATGITPVGFSLENGNEIMSVAGSEVCHG